MLTVYNILQALILILFFPFLFVYVAVKQKYRLHILHRLGFALRKKQPSLSKPGKTVWIHALSVGEVTSAQLLVSRLREIDSDLNIVFSASTRSGFSLSQKRFSPFCDLIIAFPLDIMPAVSYFLKIIKPDLFVLVETDFWPNFLNALKRRRIPAILVNGRISQKSFMHYERYSFFFAPMFKSFSHLCVQSKSDRKKFTQLGVGTDKISELGNLKYERIPSPGREAEEILKKCKGYILVAGSTHPGEEEILFDAYTAILQRHTVHLVIAPRNIGRSGEIAAIAKKHSLSTQFHSTGAPFSSDLYILDTIGDLTSFYAHCHISFVGGSIVNSGGHNPLEPASLGKPVIFGPHMSDFSEISADLLHSGGALQAADTQELTATIIKLIEQKEFYLECCQAATDEVHKMQGLLNKHIELIQKYL